MLDGRFWCLQTKKKQMWKCCGTGLGVVHTLHVTWSHSYQPGFASSIIPNDINHKCPTCHTYFIFCYHHSAKLASKFILHCIYVGVGEVYCRVQRQQGSFIRRSHFNFMHHRWRALSSSYQPIFWVENETCVHWLENWISLILMNC